MSTQFQPVVTSKRAVDCHAHILGPFDRFPLAPGRSYTPEHASLDSYLAMLDELGIERAVIVQASVFGNDNACTLDALERLGDRGRAVASVAPDAADVELRRLRKAGVMGLRLNHMQFGVATAASIAPYAAMAQKHDFHLQMFQPPQAWPALLPALLASGADWVVDHLGMVPAAQGVKSPEFQALLAALRQGGWVKLSGAYRVSQLTDYADVQPMVEALIAAAPDRCVWGTDWPHTDIAMKPKTARLLSLLADWLTPEQLENVLVKNPARLYWR
jgi:predicted TIM-barrel fold metal-dependent hydrolase